ncbi:MAG: type II secretion system F family protein [bacterium]|nr:type II secretion system F family protein [bacterium]
MPEFAWNARTAQGELVRGRTEVKNAALLGELLSRRGLILTRVRAGKSPDRRRLERIKISRKERILLTQQFADALGSGISLIDSLQEFSATYPGVAGRRLLETVHRHVEGGGTLHEALARFPRVFPTLYVEAVRSAETTGRLDQVFADLVVHLEREDELITKITSAMVYPAILFTAVAGVLALFITVLLPKLQPLFASTGTELPWVTRVLVWIGTSGTRAWPILLALALSIVVFARWGRGSAAGRGLLDRLKLRLPLIRVIVHHLALARFTRALATLFEAGVALPEALSVGASASANQVMRQAFNAARDEVISGRTCSTALAATGFFSPLDVRMVAIAERTGQFGSALMRLSVLHERIARRKIDVAVGFLEPAMILFMGAMVLGLALSIFLPIYRALDGAGG